MFVIKYRKIFYLISGLAVAASLGAILYFGLNIGIDFTGGTLVEVSYPATRPDLEAVRQAANQLNLGSVTVQPTGEDGYILRLKTVSESEKDSLIKAVTLSAGNIPVEERTNSIGPALGSELAQRGLMAIGLVALLIILYIAFVFRHVSKPVSSWKYGLIAIVALLHDIIIPTGIFAYLGAVRGAEVDALFLTALLTILGLSVNDTIVVFDRIRENLQNKVAPHFDDVVGISLKQTFARSINTSLVLILILLSLYFFGGATTRDFALVLVIGMIVGTYSSIFLASPLLVTWQKWSEKRSAK